MPFVCEEHRVGYPGWRQFLGHWLHSHAKLTRPAREDVWVEDAPPGVVIKEKAEGSRRSQDLEEGPHSQLPEAAEDEITSEVTPPLTRKTSRTPKSPYREAASATGLLDSILTRFPGLPRPVRDEIMDWAEQRGTPLAPMEVAHLLEQMGGVPRGAANISPQKYAFALDKAAREGNAEVRMLLTNWGQPGAMSSSQLGAPMWPGMLSAPRSLSYGPYPSYGPTPYSYGPSGSLEVVAAPKVAELAEQIAELRRSNEALQEELRRKGEEEKEERHRQELEAIKQAHDSQMAALSASLEELKAKLTQPEHASRVANLEAKIEQLQEAKHQAEMAVLQERITDLASKPAPSTGATEMDVVRDTATGVVAAVREAGGDIKTMVMAGSAKQNLPPGRRTPEERARLGQNLVAGLKREDATLAEAEEFFKVGA